MRRMGIVGLLFGTLSSVGLPNGSGPAEAVQAVAALDTALFADQIYPLMCDLQCNLCHSDNGVASETELQFPSPEANPQQIAAFGLWLKEFVDREQPLESLLLLKPTNREEHTGGERIKPGSEEEQLLIKWIRYLAELNDQQLQLADDQIALANRLSLQPLSIRRLTNSQYNATVRELLGDSSQPANSFPKEDFVRGFRNQAEAQGISPLLAEGYAQAAERLAANAFRSGDPNGLIPCPPSSATDADCAVEFVRSFGLRAFRRPVTDSELSTYRRLFLEEAEREADFYSGARIVVETMLQSPHFLFRMQLPGKQYGQYEVASRLSYFLWDTMPSDAMLQAASQGEFSRPEQIELVARQMLMDPRAREAMQEFLAQWMRFDNVLTATRDRRRYGDFNADIAAAMVEETKRLFDYLVWEDQNFMEFFTADYTFVSSELAKFYDLPLPEDEYSIVKYPATSGRSGVLGHGSFLVGTSKPSETSPTERGLFVRNHFLAHEVPPPPPGVNTQLPEITEDAPMTNRQRLQIHLNSEACSGCHRLIDPIGLGFEKYNAVGVYEERVPLRRSRIATIPDNSEQLGLELDTSAYIQGIEDSAFSTPKELGRILADSETCQRCIVKQLFRYAFGREETASDQPTIDVMLERFRESGFCFRELLVAVVTSDLFLQTGD